MAKLGRAVCGSSGTAAARATVHRTVASTRGDCEGATVRAGCGRSWRGPDTCGPCAGAAQPGATRRGGGRHCAAAVLASSGPRLQRCAGERSCATGAGPMHLPPGQRLPAAGLGRLAVLRRLRRRILRVPLRGLRRHRRRRLRQLGRGGRDQRPRWLAPSVDDTSHGCGQRDGRRLGLGARCAGPPSGRTGAARSQRS